MDKIKLLSSINLLIINQRIKNREQLYLYLNKSIKLFGMSEKDAISILKALNIPSETSDLKLNRKHFTKEETIQLLDNAFNNNAISGKEYYLVLDSAKYSDIISEDEERQLLKNHHIEIEDKYIKTIIN